MTVPAYVAGRLNDLLNDIAGMFKAPKITLLVRNPDTPGDADVVMTNDTWPEVFAALERRRALDPTEKSP